VLDRPGSRDIRDVRSIVGSKYNEGLQDLVNYYKTNFPDLIEKAPTP